MLLQILSNVTFNRLLQLTSTILVVAIAYGFYRLWSVRRQYSHLPQSKSHFLLGHKNLLLGNFPFKNDKPLYEIALNGLFKLAKQFRKEKMCVVWFGPEPRILLYDPELINQVLNDHLDRAPEYGSFKNVPTFIFNATEQVWKVKRKQLLPAFALNVVKGYLPLVNKYSQVTIKRLFPNDNEIEYVDNLFPEMTHLLLQIVFSACFGGEAPSDQELREFKHHAHKFFEGVVIYALCLREIVFNMSPTGKEFYKHVEKFKSFVERLYDQKLAEYEKARGSKTLKEYAESKENPVFMDFMISIYHQEQAIVNPNFEIYTKRTLIGELLVFIFGGFDTVASSLFWTLYLIGATPEVQEKVYDEIYEVFGDDMEREVTNEDLNNLKYMEAACKEATRMYPNPMLGRHTTKDFELDGKHIPKGSTILVDLFSCHHNEDVFPDSFDFRPERFLGKVQPYTFLTWSAGPRNCIGQKFALIMMKGVICNILRKYQIESMVPRSEMKPKIGFITRPTLPARTKFIKRHA